MARTKAIKAKGTILSFQVDGGTGDFTPLAAIRTINDGGVDLQFVDVTNMDSEGNYQEQLPTTFKSNDITIEGVYISDDPGRLAALDAFNAQDFCHFKIQLPKAPGQATSGDLVTFDGYIGNISVSYDYTKEITFSTKIVRTGEPTYTAGS